MVKEFLENLLNYSFPVLNRLGLMIVKPCLFEILLFRNSKRILILMLHDFYYIGNLAEPQVQQFLKCQELNFNNVLSVFGK